MSIQAIFVKENKETINSKFDCGNAVLPNNKIVASGTTLKSYDPKN
jgi:hypothetical protein